VLFPVCDVWYSFYFLCCCLQHTASHCNTPQHTATHRNTLQHTATFSVKKVLFAVCGVWYCFYVLCCCFGLPVPLYSRLAVCCSVLQCVAVSNRLTRLDPLECFYVLCCCFGLPVPLSQRHHIQIHKDIT